MMPAEHASSTILVQVRLVSCFLLLAVAALPAFARDLFNNVNLDGWEPRGDGIWLVVDGTLVGHRKPVLPGTFPLDKKAFDEWRYRQAWLYTRQEFSQYDLELEYWLPEGGNSGISLHDGSRAANAIAEKPDFTRTPARIAYEVQLNNKYPDPTITGSIYLVVNAKTGAQRDNQWNRLKIEVRTANIRVSVNGKLVAEHAPLADRAKSGPIGLQLHDQFSFAMFRGIRIREAK